MACKYQLPGSDKFISQSEFKAYLANGGLEELYPGVDFDYGSAKPIASAVNTDKTPKSDYEQKQSDMGAVISHVFSKIPEGNHYVNAGSNEKTKYITEDELQKLTAKANKELGLSVSYQDLLKDSIVNSAYTGGIGSIAKMNSSKDYPALLNSKSKQRNIRVRVAEIPSQQDNSVTETKFSKSNNSVIDPHTESTLTKAMRGVMDGKFGTGWTDRLLGTGKFKITSSEDAAKIDPDAATAQGFYDPKTDTSYLVHDNISQKDDIYGLMLHEIGTHALQLGKDTKEFQSILKQLENMKNIGHKDVVAAFKRVPERTKPEHVAEESLAYLIQNHANLSVVKRFIAWFKNQLRKLGVGGSWVNSLDTADLVSMANAALRSAPDSLVFDNAGETGTTVKNSSKTETLPSTITIDGKERPTTNSNGVQIAPTREGVENFWKWFGESKVVDDQGRPLVVYHNTSHSDITVFKDSNGGNFEYFTQRIKEQKPIPAMTLRNGVFFTPEEHEYSGYGPTKYAAYLSINNPIISKEKLSFKNSSVIDTTKHIDGAFFYINGVLKEIIAIQPNQIKSATGNTGAFSPSNNDIRYSRAEDTLKDFQTLLAPQDGTPPLQWLGGLFQRNMLIDMAVNQLPMLKTFKDLNQQRDNEVNGRDVEIDRHFKRFMKELGSRDAMMELTRVQSMATRLNDFDPEKLDSLESQNIKTKRERELTDDQREVYEAFKGLPEKSKDVYRMMREDYRRDLVDKREALIDRIRAYDGDQATKQEIIDKITAQFDKSINGKGVYFPLSRFGDFVVTANKYDEDGNILPEERVVEFVATRKAAQQLMKEMEQQGYKDRTVTLKKAYIDSEAKSDAAKDIAALTTRFIDGLRKGDIDLQEKAMLDEFNQLLIDALPDTSYRKHFVHRKGTKGNSLDGLRAYANTRHAAAKHIAALLYDQHIARQLRDADKAIKNMSNGHDAETDTAALRSVLDELRLREDALRKTAIAPWVSTVTSLGFFGALGFNISSAAVNLMQVPGVAFPELSGKYGVKSAYKQLSFAYKLLFNRKVLNEESGFNLLDHPELNKPENAQLKKALAHLIEIGKIDLTMTHDAIAMGSNPSYSDNAVTRAVGFMAEKGGKPFHIAEAVNRQVVGIAAFNLAYAKTGDYDAAIESAIDAIDRTQFDYSAGNRSRYMMGNTARVLTLFKAYALGISYYIGRNAYLSLQGESPEVRSVARKTLAVQMAMTFATSGLFGLPIGMEAAALIGGVASFRRYGANAALPGAILGAVLFKEFLLGMLGEDDEDDLETDFRNWLTDNFNQDAAEFVTKGPARLLPIGDISGRTGLDQVWWRKQNKELEGKDELQEIMLSLLGPVVGQLASFATATKLYADGETERAFESMTPRALSNAIASVRMASEGVQTVKGDKILDRDLTPWEIANKFIGLNPSDVSNIYDANSAITKQRDRYQIQKSHLVNRWINGTVEERKALMKTDIADFNEGLPKNQQITMKTLLISIKLRKAKDKKTKAGLYLSDKQEGFRDIGRFAL